MTTYARMLKFLYSMAAEAEDSDMIEFLLQVEQDHRDAEEYRQQLRDCATIKGKGKNGTAAKTQS